MFPIEVSCLKCGHSLMDTESPMEGFPSIHLIVRSQGKRDHVYLSSLYGSHRGRVKLTIPRGTAVDMFCPFCGKILSDGPACQSCDAPTVSLEMDRGGCVRICSRFGCRKHAIAFGDIGEVVAASVMNRYVVTVYENDSLQHAAATLSQYDISGVPVLNESEQITGYLTLERLLQVAYPEMLNPDGLPLPSIDSPEDWLTLRCGEAAEEDPLCVTPETPLLEASKIMIAFNLHQIPVTKNNVLVGILSRGDLFRALLRDKTG